MAKDQRQIAIEKMIWEAIRFSVWAAEEGIGPVDGENARAPEDFLFEYSKATGDCEWESLPDRAKRPE